MQQYNWIYYITAGAGTTLQCSLIPLFFSIILGTLIAIGRHTKNVLLVSTIRAYVSVIRGTPLILQLSICYFILPRMLSINISSFAAAIIAISINSSSCVSEIIRAGIESIDKGQFEAARVLNISYFDTMRDIILPQAMRNIFPALINEAVNLIKESAVVSIIGVHDTMRRSQLVSAERYHYFEPLITAGICYYLLVTTFTWISTYFEKKLHAKY